MAKVSEEALAKALLARAQSIYSANPCQIIRDGLFKITTTLKMEGGEIVESEGDESIGPFVPTDNQNRILDWFEHCQRQRRMVSIYCLKKRREGLSTVFQAIGLSRAMTINGYKVLTIAHKPGNSDEIFAIGRRMRRHLPWYFGIPDRLRRDSKEYMEIICPLFGVNESCLQNIPATDNIDSAHGQGWQFIHNSEASRYENPERYKEATSSVLMKGPWSAEVYETTSNGVAEPLFYPAFMTNWKDQGRKNYWERGYKPNKAQSLAVFFPAYTNQTSSTVALPKDVTADALMASMDDYEKWLFNACAEVWTSERGASFAYAAKRSLEHVYWRRCKIPSIFQGKDGIRLISPGSAPYPSIEMFRRMEPNTVEEAFEASYLDKPLSPDMVQCLREQVGYPKRRGVVNGAAEFVERNDLDIENFPGQYPAIRLGWSLWEDIDQTSGDLWVSIDFCEGQVHNTEQINWARDFTVAEVFDFRTGNHVAEYISQKLHSDAALDIFRFLCFCRKSHPAQQWPYVIWESPHGKAFQQLLIQHEYDWHRIFFRIKDDGLVEPSVETMGIYPSPAKRVERVQLGSQAIASRRFMNRSDLVARQAEWLIRKGTKYEAIQKDGKGEEARDDAIMAYLQVGYVDSWMAAGSAYLSPVEWEGDNGDDGSGGEVAPVEYATSADVGAFMKSFRHQVAREEAGVGSESGYLEGPI